MIDLDADLPRSAPIQYYFRSWLDWNNLLKVAAQCQRWVIRRYHRCRYNKRLQNLVIRSTLGAFEQGGIFIMSHMLRHGALFFSISFIQLPLTKQKGCGGPSLAQMLAGLRFDLQITSYVTGPPRPVSFYRLQ
jgi:hypothetical protein